MSIGSSRVRGMQDFLPARAAGLRRIARIAEDVARLYGFERVEIPILERASLYRRSLGLGSDVVMKEMYAFEDKNGDELCLRPEGTAGVMRMLIEEGLTQTLPQRWFYEGPMFRRERPQRGRFRQFHQCGVEWLERNASDDTNLEVIACAWQYLKALGIENKVILKINWLGTLEQREYYNNILREYFQPYVEKETLSLESMERLKRNPMRVLDSKNPQDQRIIKDAPLIIGSVISQKHIEIFSSFLDAWGINHIVDPKLVRGLDYYNNLVFEFVETEISFKKTQERILNLYGEKNISQSQSAVIAGGRYDGLCKQIGGNSVCSVGWAAGLERLLDLSDTIDLREKIKICFVNVMSPENKKHTTAIEKIRNRLMNEIMFVENYPVLFYTVLFVEKFGKTNPDYIIFTFTENKNKDGIVFSLRNTKKKTQENNLNEESLIEKLKSILTAEKRKHISQLTYAQRKNP